MAIIGFIVLGDRTSHGGTVITADPTWTIDDRPVARVGDKVSCPRCKRTSTIVTSRFPVVIDGGQAATFDQDRTDCGAILYSRHNGHSGHDDGSGQSSAAPAPSVIEPDSYIPPHAPRFQEHFILRNSETGDVMPGVAYVVKTAEGQVFEGETDREGRTAVVWTDSALPIDVTADVLPPKGDDPYHYSETFGSEV